MKGLSDMNTFAIIGGDIRFIRVAERLAETGFKVLVSGLGENLKLSENIMVCSPAEAVKNSDFIILPLPVTVDKTHVNTPDVDAKIPLNIIYSNCNPGQIIFGGKMDENISNTIHSNGAIAIDYLEREDFAILNAIPTAEGAIAIAMQEMAKTIYNSRCLVTGYGRISKILCRYLKSLGANVTVAARKTSDLVWAKTQCYNIVHINDILLDGKQFDVIFNTVPNMIFDANKLQTIGKESVIIDLASKPGGIDFNAAKELELIVIWALSLPGKVAPISAGDIIYDTIMTIISERRANRE